MLITKNYSRGCTWKGCHQVIIDNTNSAPKKQEKIEAHPQSPNPPYNKLRGKEAFLQGTKRHSRPLRLQSMMGSDSFSLSHLSGANASATSHHYLSRRDVLLPRQASTTLGCCQQRMMLRLTTQSFSRRKHISIHQARGLWKNCKWNQQEIQASTASFNHPNDPI